MDFEEVAIRQSILATQPLKFLRLQNPEQLDLRR